MEEEQEHGRERLNRSCPRSAFDASHPMQVLDEVSGYWVLLVVCICSCIDS